MKQEAVEDAVEGISPRERVQQRTPEQIEDVPQFREWPVEVGRLVLRERVQQPIVEETVEVSRLVLHKRVQQRSVERKILGICENFPQERTSERTQIVYVPVPQIAKEIVGVWG